MNKLALHQRIFKACARFSTYAWTVLKYWYFCFRVPKDINLYVKRWSSIDHRRDKSLAGKDFRFWYYNRKMAEWRGGEKNK